MRTGDQDGKAPGYRPDIDGLRALAVVSVILCHLSVSGFGGGRVGVDIFFVISGFVITRLLLSRFPSLTLAEFYEQRVRRLAPALAAVLLASFLAAYFLLLPQDFEDFSKSLVATVLFVSNVSFAQQGGDYFAADAMSKPLLHTWSLAIEEQFYLLYPPALLFLLRRDVSARIVTGAILGVLVISFAIAVLGHWQFRAAAFFFFPARIWELMLGALIAQAGLPLLPLPARQALAAAGLVALAAAISGVHIVPETPWQVALACLGTALLIYANEGGRTAVAAILSRPVFVGIGLLSYSLYLWHWPILVFYQHAKMDRSLTPPDIVIIVLATLAASIVSWKCLEQPIRSRRLLVGRARIVMAAAGAGAALIAIAGWGVMTGGIPSRLSPAALQFANGSRDRNPDRANCLLKEPENIFSGSFCRFGGAASPSLMLWGDSQADPWMPVFDELARAGGRSGLIAASAGCPPLLGIKRFGPSLDSTRGRCAELNEAVFAAIEKYRIGRVVLVGRWSWYIQDNEAGGVEPDEGALIVSARDDEKNLQVATAPDFRRRTFKLGLAETVARLRATGARIWVIQEPPTSRFDVPKYLALASLRGASATGPLRHAVLRRQAFQTALFAENNVAVIDVVGVLCPVGEEHCRIALDGRSLYSDWNHLSVTGTRAVARWAAPSFREIVE